MFNFTKINRRFIIALVLFAFFSSTLHAASNKDYGRVPRGEIRTLTWDFKFADLVSIEERVNRDRGSNVRFKVTSKIQKDISVGAAFKYSCGSTEKGQVTVRRALHRGETVELGTWTCENGALEFDMFFSPGELEE